MSSEKNKVLSYFSIAFLTSFFWLDIEKNNGLSRSQGSWHSPNDIYWQYRSVKTFQRKKRKEKFMTCLMIDSVQSGVCHIDALVSLGKLNTFFCHRSKDLSHQLSSCIHRITS